MQNFLIFGLIFSLIFMLKLDQPVRNQQIFVISFLIVQIWALRVHFFFSFWLIFCPLYPDPLFCLFLRFWIQEAKILRVRILSTD